MPSPSLLHPVLTLPPGSLMSVAPAGLPVATWPGLQKTCVVTVSKGSPSVSHPAQAFFPSSPPSVTFSLPDPGRLS